MCCRNESSGQRDDPQESEVVATVDEKPEESLSDQELATALNRIHCQLQTSASDSSNHVYPTILYAPEGMDIEQPGTPSKRREEALISFDKWTYPKVDMAHVEEGRSALGGLAGSKRQKSRLEEEILYATSRVRHLPLQKPPERVELPNLQGTTFSVEQADLDVVNK